MRRRQNKKLYTKLNNFMSKHTLLVNIFFLTIGLLIGILITYYFGIKSIGSMSIGNITGWKTNETCSWMFGSTGGKIIAC